MSDQSFTFSINVAGNAVASVAKIDSMMTNLTGTIHKQVSFWGKLSDQALSFNAILTSAQTLISGVVGTLNRFEDAYNVQNQAEIKLTTVMRQRTGATDEQIESIKRLASAQQALGVIGDEVQLSGAQQLATFVTQKNSIETLLPAMNNLLAQQNGLNVTEGDAVNVGNLMGKVMQGQTSALTRVGITFSEAEEKVLKYGTEQQRAAMLAKVITGNVGEMNAALADTPEGKLKQQSNTMGDFGENVGKVYVKIKAALLPIFDTVNEKLRSLIGWFEDNMDGITAVCSTVAGFLGDAFSVVGSVIGGVADVLGWLFGIVSDGLPIIAGLATGIGIYMTLANLATIKTWGLGLAQKALVVVTTAMTGAAEGWAAAQQFLNKTFAASPLGFIIGLVAVLVSGIVLCWNKFAGFRAFLITMWDTIKQFGAIIKDYIVDRIVGIITGIGSLGSAIAKLFKGDFSGAWEDAKSGVRGITGIDAAKKAVGKVSEVTGGIKSTYNTNLATEQAKDAAKKKVETETDPAAAFKTEFHPTTGVTTPDAGAIGDAVSSVGSKAAADNGGKIKNITVTIEKVVESFNVTTTNLREDASRVKSMVADALVSAVNDLNYAL